MDVAMAFSSVKNQDEKSLLHSVLHGNQTFLHSCFCFQPLCASVSFCTHQPSRSCHTPLLPQIRWFPNLAGLVTDFAACALAQPGHLLTGFWLASPHLCLAPCPTHTLWESERELLFTTLRIRCQHDVIASGFKGVQGLEGFWGAHGDGVRNPLMGEKQARKCSFFRFFQSFINVVNKFRLIGHAGSLLMNLLYRGRDSF